MERTSSDLRRPRGSGIPACAGGRLLRWIAWGTACVAAALVFAAPFANAQLQLQPQPIVGDPVLADPIPEVAIPKARVIRFPSGPIASLEMPKMLPPPVAIVKPKPAVPIPKPKPLGKTKLGDDQWFAVAASVDPVLAVAVPLATQIRNTAVSAESVGGLSVLILGDSLSLCGFGQRLDSRFRKSSQFKSVNTYMTCGTVPLSWLKTGGYTNAKTCCGYLTIETDEDHSGPVIVEDTYGNKRGTKPKPHQVPKVEDLLARTLPDILIIQTGTNFFDLFTDGKSINPERHEKALRNHIVPFMREVLKTHSSLRKIYWIGSPISGRVTGDIQQFVFERSSKFTAPVATIIDSRPLINYPYTGLQRDREHFGGADMNRWADRIFERVMGDLTLQPLPPVITAQIPEEEKPPIARPVEDEKALVVKARLIYKSDPVRTELLAYHESLTAYVYDVVKVVKGEYQEKQILVMHPAHIHRQPQPLGKYKIGETYDLRLRDIEETPWQTIKSSDTTGRKDLLPFIQTADDRKLPSRGK